MEVCVAVFVCICCFFGKLGPQSLASSRASLMKVRLGSFVYQGGWRIMELGG